MFFLAAAPMLFKKELESQEATEGGEATLSCETSSPDCKVTWWKGSTVLTHGEKYTMEQRTTTHTLVIHKLNVEDSGEYTSNTGDTKSTATLTVKGNSTSSLIYVFSLVLFSSFPRVILHSSIQLPKYPIMSSTQLFIHLYFTVVGFYKFNILR